jgi:hypothetical protein
MTMSNKTASDYSIMEHAKRCLMATSRTSSTVPFRFAWFVFDDPIDITTRGFPPRFWGHWTCCNTFEQAVNTLYEFGFKYGPMRFREAARVMLETGWSDPPIISNETREYFQSEDEET